MSLVQRLSAPFRRIPPSPLRKVLAGSTVLERACFSAAIFSLFACMGIIVDVGHGGAQPAALLVINVLFSGSIAVAYAWTAVVNPVLMIVPGALHLFYTVWLVDLIPHGPPLADLAAQRTRLRLDGFAITSAITFSYICFLVFITRTAARHVAVQTEIALARDIHRVLVPPVQRTIGPFTFTGQSLPSGDVGGDLVDVVDLGGGAWMAYVADVSGHGVSSGVLMGMTKSAVRMRLQRPTSAAEVLTDLNTILEPLKQPSMFVTAAVVTGSADGPLSFTVAGHLPILRVRADGTVDEISIPHLPVGMMPGTTFSQATLTCAPGETLALVTDGLVEVFNRRDEEFGLERLKRVLAGHRGVPMPAMAARLLDEVRGHGPQLDDQTWLFIRRGPAVGS